MRGASVGAPPRAPLFASVDARHWLGRKILGTGHWALGTCHPAFAFILLLLVAALAQADAPPSDPIAAAEKAMTDGDYAKAAAAWREAAEKRPDLPELIFNEGVALYRNNEFARAAEQFSRALASGHAALTGPTQFNLGNCEYSQAIQKDVQPPAAEEHLKSALRHYRDALAVNPKDADARANIELASRLLKALAEQKQPSSQPDKDDEQDQENPSSQPQKGDKGKPSSRPSSQKSQPQPSSQPDEQPQPASQPDQQKQEQPQPAQSQPSAQSQPAGQGQPMEMRTMSKEEAEKLLQLIRDKERQRREQQLKAQRVKRTPAEKDW